jgi:hypothetical protein
MLWPNREQMQSKCDEEKNPEKKPDHQPTQIKKLTLRSTLQTLSRLRVCAPAT